MKLNKNDIDRAIGETPEAFSACLHCTLNRCTQEAPARKKFGARLAVLTFALLLACGAAVAVVSAYGMDWWIDNRWAYIQEYNPSLYSQIKTSLQKNITQTDAQKNNNVTVRIQDAAWLSDRAFIAVQAVCDNSAYEMHPEYNFDVDGGLSDEPNANVEGAHYQHWLWTDKGFGLPEDVMTNPDKKLLVYYGTDIHIGKADGETLIAGYDMIKIEDNTVLFALEYDRSTCETDAVKAAIIQYTDADGYLTLCYPYETRLFVNGDFGDVVDYGCVTFRIKIN